MSIPTHVLPIFPLPRVVFPTEPVPLHIFEPRYQALVADCLACEEEGRPAEFVISFREDDNLARIGCTLRITHILRSYPDGRLDLMSAGLRRCRLGEVREGETYDRVEVDALADTEQDWDEVLATRAYSLHRRLLEQFSGKPPDEQEYSGQAALSWLIAPSAGLSLPQQQALLEITSENERLRALVRHCTELVARVQDIQSTGQQVQAAWELRRLTRSGAGS